MKCLYRIWLCFTPIEDVYANSGETNKALKCILKLEEWQSIEKGVVADANLAMIRISLVDLDKVFYHLCQCVKERIGPAAMIIEHPSFQLSRNDPRFKC